MPLFAGPGPGQDDGRHRAVRAAARIPGGFHASALLRSRLLRVGLAHRAGGLRRALRDRARRLRDRRPAQAGVSEAQSQGTRAAAGDRARRLERDAGDPGLRGPELSCGPAGAARRRLRLRSCPGLQRLSLRHRPCRPCAQAARLSLGRRSGGDRGDEAHGAALRRRVLRPHRGRDAQRPVGDGRGLHDLRSLSLHPVTLDGGRRARPARFPKVQDHRRRMAQRPTVVRALAEEGTPS
jgi:hypothetical protein